MGRIASLAYSTLKNTLSSSLRAANVSALILIAYCLMQDTTLVVGLQNNTVTDGGFYFFRLQNKPNTVRTNLRSSMP